MMRRITSPFAVAAALVAVEAGAAAAQEYCVACSEPNAIYRCVIENPRPGVTPSLQVLCITVMARDGGHGQCSVKRGVTVFECDGPVKKVAVTALDAPPATPAGPATQAAAAVPAPEPAGEPKTVLEAAQRAKAATDRQFAKTGEQLKNAGSATNDFFKKTFACIGSLFTRCGGE